MPRFRSACDVCHQMKVRCSGTIPCDTCAGVGQPCNYSVSSRLGRPPGAKNKRSAIEETATGQRFWVLEPPALHRGQQSDSQTQRLDNQQVSGQETLPDPTPGSSSAREDSSNTNEVDSHDYTFLGPSDGKVRRWEYDYSAAVGGTWDWSPSDSGSIIPDSSIKENTNLESSTSAVVETPQLTELSAMSVDQLPPSGPTQIPPTRSDDAQGGHPYDKIRPPQASRSCSCFEQNSKLLCTLKRSDEGQILDPTNSWIVVRIRESLKTWKALVECQSCSHDEDSDIIILALMCSRELVSQIQAEPGLYDGRTPGLSPSLMVGGYEVKDDEKSMLLHALHSIMFKKLEHVMVGLKEVLERKKRLLQATAKLATSSNDLTHADQMLQNIMTSLKALQEAHHIM
ncbi:hypothetical protein GGR51DRAFT_576848 [Nemania sp. FL0031]|nr:hypothetical protein GGR51DRAFT_576848 [Nemania sp. FL0031]